MKANRNIKKEDSDPKRNLKEKAQLVNLFGNVSQETKHGKR